MSLGYKTKHKEKKEKAQHCLGLKHRDAASSGDVLKASCKTQFPGMCLLPLENKKHKEKKRQERFKSLGVKHKDVVSKDDNLKLFCES